MATPIPQNHAAFRREDLVAALPHASCPAGVEVTSVATDTRVLSAGALYIALSGDRFDGHDHVEAAAEKGAVAALVERDVQAAIPCIRVESTLNALGDLAAHHVARWRGGAPNRRVIALTGSAGKTTTKTAIQALLDGPTSHVTVGNLNNLVGVPMTALGLRDEHTLAVFELGTNAPGEIAALARIANADVALVTLIAAAHTEGLGGIEGVAAEKGALFDALGTGTAVGNHDDERVRERAQARSNHVTYGTSEDADYHIRGWSLVSPTMSRIRLRTPHGEVSFSCPLVGRSGALAAAAAVAALEALGGRELDSATLDEALGDVSVDGRLAPRELGTGLWIIDDSYNANPASCRSSIATAVEMATFLGRRLVLVLGEMRELGALSEEEHRSLGDVAAATGAEVIAVSGDAQYVHEAMIAAEASSRFVEDAQRAAIVAKEMVTAADLVLVKGSRGVHTELVVEALERAHGGAA